jgi:hypothetical protein
MPCLGIGPFGDGGIFSLEFDLERGLCFGELVTTMTGDILVIGRTGGS